MPTLHTAVSYVFVLAAVARLALGCATGIAPSKEIRFALATESSNAARIPSRTTSSSVGEPRSTAKLGNSGSSPPCWRIAVATRWKTSLRSSFGRSSMWMVV